MISRYPRSRATWLHSANPGFASSSQESAILRGRKDRRPVINSLASLDEVTAPNSGVCQFVVELRTPPCLYRGSTPVSRPSSRVATM